MSTKARIESVRIEHVIDNDSDTSYLGEYTNEQTTKTFVRHGQFHGKQIKKLTQDQLDDLPSDRREYRFFLPTMTGEETGSPESPRQDFERMETLQNHSWNYIGIIAKTVIISAQGVTQTIRSVGLYDVESDTGKDHIESVEQEELAGLCAELKSFGFGKRAIDYAFKGVGRKNC